MKEKLYYLFKNTSFKNNFMEFFVKQFLSAILGFILALFLNNFKAFIIAVVIFILLTAIISIFLSTKQHQFDILDILRQEQKKSNWIEIIRLGYPLSRPLWLSGRYNLRIEIGEIVKKAASCIDEDVKLGKEKYSSRYVLASVLIDDLGWTRFAIGQASKAVISIKEGIRIAEENLYYELAIKGYRHLIGIYSKSEKDLLIQDVFVKIEELSKNLDLAKQKEIKAGLLFSQAEYYTHINNFEQAEKLAKKAQEEYLLLEDRERYVKTFHLLGEIYLKMGVEKYSEAETVINRGVAEAEKWQRKERYIRLIILLIHLKTLIILNDDNYSKEEYYRDKYEIDRLFTSAESLCKDIQNDIYLAELKKINKNFIKTTNKRYRNKK